MLFVCHRTVIMTAVYRCWTGKIRSGFLDEFDTIKSAVSLPLKADKHLVNRHHVIRKTWRHTGKKVLTWCILMYRVIVLKQIRGIINIIQKRAKTIRGCPRSTGKSSTKKIVKHTIHFTLLQKNQAIVAVRFTPAFWAEVSINLWRPF